MKLRVTILALLAVLSFSTYGQMKKGINYSGFFDSYYWRGPVSVTGGIGLAGYSGDLCSDFTCIKPSLYYTLGVGYKLWPRVFVGGEIDYFTLNATDKSATRGYEFKSKNLELAGYVNFYLREDIVKRHQDLVKGYKIFKPYLYLGASGMRYNVTDNIGETTYPKYAFLIPVGLGANFHITHRVNVKLEGVYKIGFSDYLDGASEFASPDKNDSYGIIRAKLVYTPFARRVKTKKVKVDPEQRKLWNDRNAASSGGESSGGNSDSGSSSDSGSDSSSGEDANGGAGESESWDEIPEEDNDPSSPTEESENTEEGDSEGDSDENWDNEDSGDDWGSDGW